jgi:hypothetical protein
MQTPNRIIGYARERVESSWLEERGGVCPFLSQDAKNRAQRSCPAIAVRIEETDPQGMGMKYIPWALTVPVTTGVSTPVLKLSWPTNVGAAE